MLQAGDGRVELPPALAELVELGFELAFPGSERVGLEQRPNLRQAEPAALRNHDDRDAVDGGTGRDGLDGAQEQGAAGELGVPAAREVELRALRVDLEAPQMPAGPMLAMASIRD